MDQTKSGKYYAYILYEYAVKEPEPVVPSPETTLGLKYSMRHFYAADNGEMADPPQWLKESREKLVKIQRRLCRMQPGSKNYQEMVQKYRLLHEHIANQRRDFIHKESRRIANAWDAVCMRGDSMTEMSQKLNHGKVLESGCGAFRECLRYKLARQGKALIMVDRYTPTSRTCSACGLVLDDAVSYKRRLWTCPKCGAVHDREINAAKNIKAEGLARYQRMQKREAA